MMSTVAASSRGKKVLPLYILVYKDFTARSGTRMGRVLAAWREARANLTERVLLLRIKCFFFNNSIIVLQAMRSFAETKGKESSYRMVLK